MSVGVHLCDPAILVYRFRAEPPDSDIWAQFADFLTELIARHAEELEIDSWPDPKKVIMLQELRDMYYRFMKLSIQARKEADARLPLEI